MHLVLLPISDNKKSKVGRFNGHNIRTNPVLNLNSEIKKYVNSWFIFLMHTPQFSALLASL
jgi:hypothetical protein